MSNYSSQLRYIRHLASTIDTNEPNQTPGDAGLVNGTYCVSSGNMHYLDVKLNDNNNDGIISDNHNPGATANVSYTVAQGEKAGTSLSGNPDVTFLAVIVIKTNGGIDTYTTA